MEAASLFLTFFVFPFVQILNEFSFMFKPILTFCLAGVGLACLGVTFSSAAESVQRTERLQKLMTLDRPIVIAHRGYKMAAPENTLPAFKLGLLAQADLVELDYYHSSDNVPVVFHDWSLDRTTNADALWKEKKIALASKTVTQLQELDAGAWFSPLYQGVKIPTLGESLDLIQAGSVTLIERKKGDPKTLVDLLKRKEMLNDVFVQAFDWDFIASCHELAPGLALGTLGPPRKPDGSAYPREERYLNSMFLDRVEKTGASVVGWNSQVTKAGVAEAHRRGLRVWVYTINELDDALRLLEIGVDGIISDNPAMVWKAIALHTAEAK